MLVIPFLYFVATFFTASLHFQHWGRKTGEGEKQNWYLHSFSWQPHWCLLISRKSSEKNKHARGQIRARPLVVFWLKMLWLSYRWCWGCCCFPPPFVWFMALNFLFHCPLQTPRVCGTSLPAPRTSALPNNGCVMGRTTAKTALTRACRSVVSALSASGRLPWVQKFHLAHMKQAPRLHAFLQQN